MDYRQILIDTSIVIDHLRKKDKTKSVLYRITDKCRLCISAVSVFELYAGSTDERKKSDMENLISIFEILPFTSDIAEESGRLYRSLRKANQGLEVKDIFIGATALFHNLPLLTLNTKHFDRIKDLKMISVDEIEALDGQT